jgi:TonB family protein
MFESSLTNAPRDHSRSASLSVALGMHLLALLPIAAISYLVVDDITDPDPIGIIDIVSVAPITSAPVPPDRRAAAPERGRPIPRLGKEGGGRPDAPSSPPAPSVVASDLDALLESAALDPAGDLGFGPGTEDSPFGVPGGDPGGFGNDITGIDPPGGDGGPVPVTADIEPPRLITKVTPEYPSVARAAKVTGKVVVQATISTSGDVVDASIVSSRSELLNQAALDAVRRWKYRPARRNGEPVAVYFTVRVEFTLQ